MSEYGDAVLRRVPRLEVGVGDTTPLGAEALFRTAEKNRCSVGARGPVPQTDTGGWVEQTKVRERNHVKELGKIAS